MHIKVSILLYVNYITINLTLKSNKLRKMFATHMQDKHKKYILPNISTELFN